MYNLKEKHSRKYWSEYDREDYECPRCGTEIGPFEVHHKNGNSGDGRIENLVALCGSCHWDAHEQKRFDEHPVEGWKREFYEEVVEG